MAQPRCYPCRSEHVDENSACFSLRRQELILVLSAYDTRVKYQTPFLDRARAIHRAAGSLGPIVFVNLSWRGQDPRPVHPLAMSFAANWTPYHLRDFRALFDELLRGFCLDLIARAREPHVNLSEDTARRMRQNNYPIGQVNRFIYIVGD